MTKDKKRQYEVMYHAKQFGKHDDWIMCSRYLKKAQKLGEITKLQWYLLEREAGPNVLEKIVEEKLAA